MTEQDGLPEYSKVYEKLVQSDDDVIGLVSYALYKQDKRDWLIEWQRDHGASPTSAQVDAFVTSKTVPGQRDRYRAAARAILDAYAAVAVEEQRPSIVEGAVTERIANAALAVERSGKWYRQIPGGVAAAFIYTAILIGIALVLRYAGVDIIDVIEKINATG